MRNLVILGAGAIGCYLGGTWSKALSAQRVRLTLLGRDRVLAPLRKGMHINGHPADLSAAHLTSSPECLARADLIIVAAKTTAVRDVVSDIRDHAAAGTPVLSLMNGLEGLGLPKSFDELAGMVPFNVAWLSDHGLSRSSAGEIVADDHPALRILSRMVARTAAPIALTQDVTPLRRGKLLLNLVNPVNALSGIALHRMLSQRNYRRVCAAAITEALRVYDAGRADWRTVGPFSPRLARHLLKMPDFLFNPTLLRLQKIDRTSQTSMAQDLNSGKPTEIEALNGEIVRLGRLVGVPAPVNDALVRLVHAAEAQRRPPRLSAERLLREVGLA